MSCIITLKINDYYPKIDSIPYENFICLFTYGDFFVKIPLIQKSNNICKHEIETISSDIKYNIHILEYNESSLIGISEMVIPFIKIKKINAPGTMVQEQKVKLIIDLNTKRKLFGKIINSGDIYLVLSAEVFIPDKKNIIINNDLNNININLNDGLKKKNSNKQIKVRISNKTNNVNGTPRTLKKQKMLIEMKSNREIIKKDISIDNINNNYQNNSIQYNFNNDEKNKTGTYINKMKLDNNQVKIIDFRNKNENNIITKDIKKKISKKRSPRKKITILELLEQKMQNLLSNNNNEINNSRSNTYYSNGNNTIQNSDTKKNNKTDKKIKNKNKIENNNNNFNNIIKKFNKKDENIKSNKFIYSVINSPDILSPNHNIRSPNTIDLTKRKKNNSKGINRINKQYNNDIGLYNKILNETEINNYNKLVLKNKRNSSQEEINRDIYKTNNYKEKKHKIKINSKREPKTPNMDISVDIFQRKSNNNKLYKDKSKKNNSSYSNININDLTSNNGLLSTDERTEQGLSEIDKIILEKGAELREQFQNQFKYNNSNNKDLNNKSDNSKNNRRNSQNINQLYYDMGDNPIIGAGNFTFDTPKISKDFDSINNLYDAKTPLSSSQNMPFYFTQEELKNNYIRLIDLYHLLNQKLSKIIFENNDLYKKLRIYKEYKNNEIQKQKLKQYKKYNYEYNYYINANMIQSLNVNVLEKLSYIKNIENKLYQEIFDYTYDDYEIIRIKEIERVNKLNEERNLNILLKVLNCIVIDCGNVSQIFKGDMKKQNLLKDVLAKNNIIEKKEGDVGYINLQNINFNNNINYKYNKFNKYNKYNNILNEDDIFEDKVIREVDEDKEEEESVYSGSNKEKNTFNFNATYNSQNIESIRQSLKNEENEISNNNNNNEKINEEKEKIIEEIEKNEENLENNYINNENNDNQNEIEENKKINIMKDILINNFKEKYGKKSLFTHINKTEFLFDNKYTIFVELINNNENYDIIIEIDKNKYNIEEFISIYYKNDNQNETENNNNKKEKNKFVYKKKISHKHNKINEKKKDKEEENYSSVNNDNSVNIENNDNNNNDNNVHQKKRRKRRIIDDDSEEEEEQKKNKKENNEEIITSSSKDE